jgi:hypothetical protein
MMNSKRKLKEKTQRENSKRKMIQAPAILRYLAEIGTRTLEKHRDNRASTYLSFTE